MYLSNMYFVWVCKYVQMCISITKLREKNEKKRRIYYCADRFKYNSQ